MSAPNVSAGLQKVANFGIGLSAVLIVLGLIAVILPMGTGISIAILVSWMLVLARFAHLAQAFFTTHGSSAVWRFVVGLAYVVGGFYLVFHPALGLASLTLWLASIFVVEGAMRIAFFFAIRAQAGAV